MSDEYILHALPRPVELGLSGLAEIEQNIRVILRTLSYSLPMDRAFADVGAYIDSPLPHQTALAMADIVDAVEKYEPRVKVLSVTFQADPEAARDGKLYPLLRFTLAQGVEA